MKYGRAQRADPLDVRERKAKAEANVREANLRFDMSMRRTAREMSRCQCGHSKAVHIDRACQMECGCVSYRKR